jgi:DNA-binding protein YbaB
MQQVDPATMDIERLDDALRAMIRELRGQGVSASGGNGAVSVRVRGDGRIERIRCDAAILEQMSFDEVLALIVKTAQEAHEQAERIVAKALGGLAGGAPE